MLYWLRSTHICFRPLVDDVTRINFRFRLLVMWSSQHGLYNLMQDIFIQSKVIDIFPKFKMAAAAILDFQFVWIWPFRRVGSVVFVFCTKFSWNICYSHWDRRTYASDLHFMTSRVLTSGFDLWSRGHLCMAVMHLSMKFGADILSNPELLILFGNLRWWPPPSWICLGEPWDHPRSLIRGAYLL